MKCLDNRTIACRRALVLVTTSLLLAVAADGKESSIESLRTAALLAERQGKPKLAGDLWRKAVALTKDSSDASAVAEVLYGASQYYRKTGSVVQAIPLATQLVAIKKAENNDQYLGLAWNISDLADLYYQRGQWSQCIPLYKDAIDTWTRLGRWPDMISSLDKLGNALSKVGDKAASESAYKNALESGEKALSIAGIGKSKYRVELDLAQALSDYSVLLQSLHRTSEANKLEDKARALRRSRRKSVGSQYPTVSQNLKNPYLAAMSKIQDRQEFFEKRLIYTQQYAWGMPDERAIRLIKQYEPIVEIGAGSGYWTYLLRQLGTKVVAFDINPVETRINRWHAKAPKSWSTVLQGTQDEVTKFPNYTLFLCWPPGVNMCAYDALRLFKGKHVILVGEEKQPCSAPIEFHQLLARDWRLIKRLDIPQWPGIYDSLFVFERKRKS
jgi:tetratricopeptide (TPR) repeat protein